VQWSSGAITEIEVPRWTRGEMFTTSKTAREQIRAPAAEGHRDEEIGAQRNVDRRRGEAGARLPEDRARRPGSPSHPGPARSVPHGRHSISGAAKKLHFSVSVVRR
jgi:hypothetical protein